MWQAWCMVNKTIFSLTQIKKLIQTRLVLFFTEQSYTFALPIMLIHKLMGSSTGIDDRLLRHNAGYEKFTSKGKPWS